MTMRGIDISSYQAGIDLTLVPCDFAVVKATQGTGYMNPDCVRAVEQALAAGKCAGVYHYIDGSGVGEADFFADQISGWVGRVLVCLDWEPGSNARWGDTGYLAQVIDRVRERTGRPPVVYASASAFPWQTCTDRGCGTWVAQYADMNPTGHQDHPWGEGAYQCDIRQYSATGRLPGWDGDLDLDKAYITREQWLAYTGEENDMQLTDIIRRPDGHEATVNDVLAYLDQRIEALSRITRPDGRTVDLATIAAYADQRLERLESIVYGSGLRAKNPDGSDTDQTTDLATEAAWAPANVARILQASGVSDEQIAQIRQAIVDAKIQVSIVGPTPAVEGDDTAPDGGTVVVQAGETLAQIAAAHGTTVADILAANPGRGDGNSLRAGDVLTLPAAD
ncbi:MAG: GH25 family lysozyme [Propionibacterium acidifaciens]|uniref:GH25 family lysozyme n=1 Tax=Propionibacterium acidifaciens TaxID=556499 RepID=UPI00360DDC3F